MFLDNFVELSKHSVVSSCISDFSFSQINVKQKMKDVVMYVTYTYKVV